MKFRIAIKEGKMKTLTTLAREEVTLWRSELESLEFVKMVEHSEIEPQLRPSYGEIVLRGTKGNIQKILTSINHFMSKIVTVTDFIITSPGALSYLESYEGSQSLKNLQSSKKVIIREKKNVSSTYARVSVHSEKLKITGRIEIEVQQGKISRQFSNVIVFPSIGNLEICGALRDDLLDQEGIIEDIEEECNTRVRHGKLLSGEIYVSKPGKLSNCKHIIHAVGPEAVRPNSADIMNVLLSRCIRKAHELKAIKIALPLSFSCPVDQLTDELVIVVNEFLSQVPNTTLRDIRIVDMDAIRLYRCIQKLKEHYPQARQDSNSGSLAATVNGRRRPFVYNENTLSTEEGVTVELFKGSICDVEPPVDVIVNSTSSDLNLSLGQLSITISKQAGSGLQEEVKKKAPGGITKAGAVVQTESHNIYSSKYVYHTALNPYDGPKGNSITNLCRAIRRALMLADKERHSSIALPAIGSGVLGIPKASVIRCLFEEVNRYSQKYPATSVRRVVLVAYDKDTKALQNFTETYDQLVRNARSGSQTSTYTFLPHDYVLLIDLNALSADSLDETKQELTKLFTNSVTSELIHRTSQPCLDQVDADKAKALECLQYTHRVKITLQKSSDRLDSIIIEGFVDDVTQAKQDALKILSM